MAKKVLTDSRREKFISVDVWDTQVGGWMNLDEAPSVNEAEKLIQAFKDADYFGEDRTYSVYQVVRDLYV